ncbi:MAG: CapA family protein [candidate division Zixibacteria bacterium]|nr:CapA family protein [candidate division Zixibacteria bacterium]
MISSKKLPLLFLLFNFISPFIWKSEAPLLQENPFLVKEHNLILVGDIMLSRGVDVTMKNKGYLYPFKNIAEITNSAEVTFGNLESPLSNRGTRGDQLYSFRGNPEAVKGLLYAGFKVLNLANNHSYDYGKKAFEQTLEVLNKNNIKVIGAGKNVTEARMPAIFDLGDLKIAFLGYDLSPGAFPAGQNSSGVAKARHAWIIKDLEKAKEAADFVIVSFHWGIEYQDFPTEYQKSLAHMAIDCGADIVVGHHPHTFQGIEIYKGKLIAYSLGNFVFDQKDLKNNQSFILKVTFDWEKLHRIEIIPIELVTFPHSPKVAEGKMAQEILDRLYFDSSIFGTEFELRSERGVIKDVFQ